ncbi:TetR/AcrR family transcriptional regulator [Streptomyces sp. NBC_01408]|uniref:TetR/AcrR family transcriptional regulator n=1 Tax=Streptomyces sp. NBC_01408 TaxID=2903855 RepID=UPI0022597386|nr:TetR family transcriptional regulator [Streptomyces sp. NBC_01408]MCX4696960.1 TetR family transcriptional regulator [Streptomyces sp. NBC_01408]
MISTPRRSLTTLTEKTRRTRRHDPDRRERITEVAVELIAERGLEGLTHRAIAERADVSLSSTTYHFADREALIRAALERAADRFAGFVRSWAEEYSTAGPERIAEALADSVMACLGEGRTNAIVEYELHTAALRRPDLREAASLSARASTEALTPLVGPVAAATIPPLMTGLCLRAMTAPTPPTRDEVLTILRSALHPPQ